MNYFKILQLLRPHIKAGRLDYKGAILYLEKIGIKMDGILKKGLDNLFKKGKARDREFGNVVHKLPKDDAGKLFNPKNPLKDYSKKNLVKGKNKKGVETLFEETKVNWKDTTLPYNPKAAKFYDEIVEESTALAKRTGRDIRSLIEERIGYNFSGKETMKEIIDIVLSLIHI